LKEEMTFIVGVIKHL